MVDFDYAGTPPPQIAQSIVAVGVAVLRGALAPDYVARVKQNLERIYALHRRLADRSPEAESFFADWPDFALAGLAEGNVLMSPYEAKFSASASAYSFFEDPKFKRICEIVLGPRYKRTGTDNLMTVHPPSLGQQNTTSGIDLHTDGMYFNDQRFGLTVWFPLDPCGETSPGLEVVLAGYEEVRAYAGFDLSRPAPAEPKWNWHHYRDGAFSESELRAHFPPQRWLAPVFGVGDLLIISNWALHGSYRKPGMTGSRSAVQIRVEGKSLNPRSHQFSLRKMFARLKPNRAKV